MYGTQLPHTRHATCRHCLTCCPSGFLKVVETLLFPSNAMMTMATVHYSLLPLVKMNSANRFLLEPGVHDPGAIKFFFYLAVLTGDGLGGSLAKEVLVVDLNGEDLGPVLTCHCVYRGLKEDDVLPVDDILRPTPSSTFRGHVGPLGVNVDGHFSVPISSTAVVPRQSRQRRWQHRAPCWRQSRRLSCSRGPHLWYWRC